MKNYRVKMTAIVVLVMLAVTGLLMLISYQNVSTSMMKQLETNYSVAADKYAQELTAWVNTNATIIDALAAEITSSGIYDSGYDSFHQFLADNCRILNKNGYIFDIYFTYPDNSMACASDFLADGTVDYVHERDWFTVPAGTGELYYSTPYLDSDSGKPIITISKAVFKDRKLQGVIAADIFVDVLVDIISEADVAADSYAFLVDQNLGMIVHPNEAYAFDDEPYGVMDIPGAPYADVVSKIRSNSRDTVYLEDYDGITRGVVVSRMENTGWYVGIATSKSVLMSSMNSLVRGFLIATAIAVAVCGIIAVFLAYVLDKHERQRMEYKAQVEQLKKQANDSAPSKTRFPLETATDADEFQAKNPSEKLHKTNLIIPILIILGLMICMVFYTYRTIHNVAVTNIQEVGEDRLSAATARLENYLETSKSSLWVTADTVDHMIHSGASTDEILAYITEETTNQKQHFDVNINGLYGYIMGEYLDGIGWEPSENYDPTRRDWYLAAVEAKGDATIVSPYMDAQTDGIVISISRMLSSGTDVLSIDLTMNHIQEIVSDLQIKGKGYGFIVSDDGMLIAHRDETQRGHLLTEDEEQLALLDGILETKNGIFEIDSAQGEQTVFVHQILDQWYVVIVISSRELFAEVRQQSAVSIAICAVIFALITFFYLLGRRNEQNYSRRIEEMRVEEQRQAFEAKALKLEKEAADRSNKAKSDFLAEMSHEIRTPINAVLGMNEMILRESTQTQSAVSPDIQSFITAITGYARNIESAGSNLLAIINDILDFSKIEAGKMDIVEGTYHLSSIVNDLSNMTYFKAKEKGLDFVVDVDETLPDALFGDEVRVRQIITNLLNNAVKYTGHGCVRLSLRGEIQGPTEPGQIIRLTASVEDTGIGIRKEDIEKLFTKFQRLDLKQNSTVEGTGLGLAITHNLLGMMGGSIDVASDYGKGSVFTVSIPQKIVSVEPVGDFQSRFQRNMIEAEVYRETFRAPDAHILIVDDTKMNLTVAVGLLKNTEIQIDTATGGEEAIKLAQTRAYDLILMDQRMPKMDGTEALHLIRSQANGANRETPVICLTADAVIGAKEKYIAQGFTDYLTKPIDSKALEMMLVKYLPEDKVIPIRIDITDGSDESHMADGYAPLRRAEIDPDVGLGYCQQNDQLYRSVLREYVKSAEEKTQDAQKYYEDRDWQNYSVIAHAIKSSSRTIGATTLAEMAARLEAAAEESREQPVVFEHDAMLQRFQMTVQAIQQLLGDEVEDSANQEDEILEFMPDDI